MSRFSAKALFVASALVLPLFAFGLGVVSSGSPFTKRRGDLFTAPLLLRSWLALDLVPGRDGVEKREVRTVPGGRTTLSSDELTRMQAYAATRYTSLLDVPFGADEQKIVESLTGSALAKPSDLGPLNRIWYERKPIVARAIDRADLLTAAIRAGRYLARVQRPDGRFHYLLDAVSGAPIDAEYSYPRHAGTTHFLNELVAVTGDQFLALTAQRARTALVEAVAPCSPHGTCLIENGEGSVIAAALAILALLPETDGRGKAAIDGLEIFVSSAVNERDEFFGTFNVARRTFSDVGMLYVEGESILALLRKGNPSPELVGRVDRAFERALDRWQFLGDRYYIGQHHWTCQAVLAFELAHRRSERGLDFCERHQRLEAQLQITNGSEDDGAFGVLPLPVPQLAQAAAIGEGWIATYDAMQRAGRHPSPEFRASLHRLLAYLLRAQNLPAHLLKDPGRVDGAFPTSRVDLQLRIDMTQHAGSALLRASQLNLNGE